jgi:hypothetical protein
LRTARLVSICDVVRQRLDELYGLLVAHAQVATPQVSIPRPLPSHKLWLGSLGRYVPSPLAEWAYRQVPALTGQICASTASTAGASTSRPSWMGLP